MAQRKSFMYIVVGEERSGKTFFTTRGIANAYIESQGNVLCYKPGMEEDYPEEEYAPIRALTFNEHIQHFYPDKDAKRSYSNNKQIEYFEYEGNFYHFKDFNSIFQNKKIQLERMYDVLEENRLFNSFHKYIHSTLLIFDDSLPLFSRGLKPSMEQLFFAKNHTGKKSSVKGKSLDVVLMYHNIDHANARLWDATTGMILLKWEFSSGYKKLKNRRLVDIIENAQNHLKDAPQYTALEIPLRGENSYECFDVTLSI